MTDKELRKDLKEGSIARIYLLLGDEPLLIDNAIAAVKEALKVDNPFDFESVSLPDASIDDILPKVFTGSFLSGCRLFVLRNLEELSKSEVEEWHEALYRRPLPNCVILTYVIEKENSWRKGYPKEIASFLPETPCVHLMLDRTRVREWILRRDKRSALGLSPEVIDYLEDEFDNDITGLKNEFEKIENYLAERKSLSADEIRSLSAGPGDFDTYRFVNSFFAGGRGALGQFEDCRSFLSSYLGPIAALGKRLIKNAAQLRERGDLPEMADALLAMDRKVKTSSTMVDLYLAIFLTRQWGVIKKGAAYGK